MIEVPPDVPAASAAPARRRSAVRIAVGAVVVLTVAVGVGVAYRQRDRGPFVDQGAVTHRIELPTASRAFVEPAGPGVGPTLTAAAAFAVVDDQRYPGEQGRPEVMFGLVTFPGSDGWDRRPAWVILRRHVLGMSTMSPTPFFTNQVDTVDPDTGQRLIMVQGGGGPVGMTGAG